MGPVVGGTRVGEGVRGARVGMKLVRLVEAVKLGIELALQLSAGAIQRPSRRRNASARAASSRPWPTSPNIMPKNSVSKTKNKITFKTGAIHSAPPKSPPSQSEAALLLGVYAFLGMALTLILGWVADRANKPRMAALILFAAAGAMFLPIVGSSLWSLCLFTIFFAAVETTFPLGWAVVGDLFGRKHYAKIRGYMTLFYTWGGVLGPVIAGAIFDRWQTYEPLLWSLVVVFIVAGLFFASLNRSWQKATGRN